MGKIVIHDFKDWLKSEIVTNPDYFNSPKVEKGKDVPSYRLVLCHSLWRFVKNEKSKIKNQKDVQKIIEPLMEKLDAFIGGIENNPKINFIKEDFLELFPFYSDNKDGKDRYGLVLVDKTGGTFPLVLYPLRGNYKNGDRLVAFKASVSNVKNEIASISDIILRSEGWDWMQAKVLFFDLFEYVKSKKTKSKISYQPQDNDDW